MTDNGGKSLEPKWHPDPRPSEADPTSGSIPDAQYRPVEMVKAGTMEMGNVTNQVGQVTATAVPVLVQPTQVRRPWRSAFRTVFQGAVGLASLAPVIAVGVYQGDDPGTYPYAVGQALAVAGAVTRVMAVPGVEAWLRRWVPWLAAAPKPKVARG